MSTQGAGDTAKAEEHAPPSYDNTSGDSLNQHEPSKRSNRFRFKSKHSATSSARHFSRSRSRSPSHRSRHYHRRHHHARHRRKRSRTPSPLPNSDAAFRISLFDALGDDEGAAFWEGVYGQPIHTYSDQKIGPEGELERMTDEEYSTYVRRRMWEKSQEGIEEERRAKARLRQEKEKQRADEDQRQRKQPGPRRDRDVFDFEIEASLRRGEKRKWDKEWKQRWEVYLKSWADLNVRVEKLSSTTLPEDATRALHTLIPWPTSSGHQRDVSPDSIQSFFRSCVTAAASSGENDDAQLALMTALKTERVRWHPDKVQHRYGRLGVVDKKTLEAVTAVFQIVDGMWNEERGKS